MKIPNCVQHPDRPVPAVGAIQYFITHELFAVLSRTVSPRTLKQFQEGWNTGGAMCREDLEAYKKAQEKSGMQTREIGIEEYLVIREGKKASPET